MHPWSNEYGEPEKPGEHCEVAADTVFAYMEELGYGDIDSTVSSREKAFELYLFAKHLHGAGKLEGECTGFINRH